jgi:hypothetical protein
MQAWFLAVLLEMPAVNSSVKYNQDVPTRSCDPEQTTLGYNRATVAIKPSVLVFIGRLMGNSRATRGCPHFSLCEHVQVWSDDFAHGSDWQNAFRAFAPRLQAGVFCGSDLI